MFLQKLYSGSTVKEYKQTKLYNTDQTNYGSTIETQYSQQTRLSATGTDRGHHWPKRLFWKMRRQTIIYSRSTT